MKYDLGAIKVWGDVVTWYWSKLQCLFVFIGFFKYMGLSWYLSLLALLGICVMSLGCVWWHITFVTPRAAEYMNSKNLRFMNTMKSVEELKDG